MIDQFGRNIDYMRLSLTERCNLRCRYCMPEGARREAEEDVLRYEALLRGGCTEGELRAALRKAIYEKPRAHCFERRGEITESRLMGEIGG